MRMWKVLKRFTANMNVFVLFYVHFINILSVNKLFSRAAGCSNDG